MIWNGPVCHQIFGVLTVLPSNMSFRSQKLFTHATPTLFNAGTPRPQLSSCFLLTVKEDSIEGIYDTLKNCACISKYAGGIGVSVHNVRARDSYIRGSNGTSNGIVPMLRVFNDTGTSPTCSDSLRSLSKHLVSIYAALTHHISFLLDTNS